jgi:hypothetical protein
MQRASSLFPVNVGIKFGFYQSTAAIALSQPLCSLGDSKTPGWMC